MIFFVTFSQVSIPILLLIYHVLSKNFFLAKLDSEVRGLLKCYKTKANYSFRLQTSSRFPEYYIKLNCSSTASEEV